MVSINHVKLFEITSMISHINSQWRQKWIQRYMVSDDEGGRGERERGERGGGIILEVN